MAKRQRERARQAKKIEKFKRKEDKKRDKEGRPVEDPLEGIKAGPQPLDPYEFVSGVRFEDEDGASNDGDAKDGDSKDGDPSS